MIVLGLTGGIGMGKSTLACQLRTMGAKICCADAIVHRLMAKDGDAVAAIGKAFSGVVKNNAVDRKALGEIVFGDKEKLKILEQILHPLVVAEENHFIEREGRKGAKIVVLDIPLLFETGADERCDFVMVANAPAFLQRQRVIKRPGMNAQKFKGIVSAQMPEREKRLCADLVVATGLGKGHSFRTMAPWVRMFYEA